MSKKIVWGIAAALSALGIAAVIRAKKASAMSKGFVDYVQGQNTPEAKAYIAEHPPASPQPKFDSTKFGYNPDLVLPLPLVVAPLVNQVVPAAEPSPLVVLTPEQPALLPSPAAPAAPAPAPAPVIEFSTTPTSGVYEPSDQPESFLPTPVATPAPEYYPPADNQQSIEGLAGFLR